jgi:hypothetical protein
LRLCVPLAAPAVARAFLVAMYAREEFCDVRDDSVPNLTCAQPKRCFVLIRSDASDARSAVEELRHSPRVRWSNGRQR